MKALLLALAFVSIGAAADFSVPYPYLGSCGGSVSVYGSSIDVRSNDCKNVTVYSAYNTVLADYKLNESYDGLSKFSGIIPMDYAMQNSISTYGYVTVVVSSNSGAHSDQITVNWVAPVVVYVNNQIPAGWYYGLGGFLGLECVLVDHTGTEVAVMDSYDSCTYGSTTLPLGWSFGFSTQYNDPSCYVWKNNWDHTPSAVRKQYCGQ